MEDELYLQYLGREPSYFKRQINYNSATYPFQVIVISARRHSHSHHFVASIANDISLVYY